MNELESLDASVLPWIRYLGTVPFSSAMLIQVGVVWAHSAPLIFVVGQVNFRQTTSFNDFSLEAGILLREVNFNI